MRKIKKLLCVIMALSLSGTMYQNLTVSASNTNVQANTTTNTSKDTNRLSYITMSQGGKTSCNVSDNTYTVWSSPINSYINENVDGGFTRIEAIKYYGANASGEVIIENHSNTFQLASSASVQMELPVFGGYFKGENCQFLVFGQNNLEESNSVEVMRVVKYDNNWNRIDSCSVYGANTQYPFDAGCLRMTEADGMLFIHTSHQMYQSDDGLNHQENMTFVINQSSMEVAQTSVYVYITYGPFISDFVSHSFNQFVISDGEYLYRLDHGDAYPRAVVVRKCKLASIDACIGTNIMNIEGEYGDNFTGASVGGFELVGNNLITAGNSVEQKSENWSAYGKRNIFVAVTDKDLTDTKTIWLTDYTDASTITVGTPQLVKTPNNELYVMWEEKDSTDSSIFVKMVKLDMNGNKLSDIYKIYARLSDCQPIYTSAGNIVWYVTDEGSPVFYQLDENKLNDYNFTSPIAINDCHIELEKTQYTYQPDTYQEPKVAITYGEYALEEGTHYTVTYQNNCSPGKAVVTITGKGILGGVTEQEFLIIPYKKQVVTDTKNKCKVTVTSTSVANPTVTYTQSTNKNATSIKVPDTVEIGGVKYKVTSIAASAFANNKKLTKVTIGRNVTSIRKNAFKNCTKLKTVTIKSTGLKTIGANAFQGDKKLTTITLKSTKLTAKSVSKTALKGTNSKLVIKVPAKKVAAYKKYFKNKGNAKVKVKKM